MDCCFCVYTLHDGQVNPWIFRPQRTFCSFEQHIEKEHLALLSDEIFQWKMSAICDGKKGYLHGVHAFQPGLKITQ